MFKPGQKVVCVSPIDNLVKDKTYTVHIENEGLVYLTDHPDSRFGWDTRRFKPCTDISFFEHLLDLTAHKKEKNLKDKFDKPPFTRKATV